MPERGGEEGGEERGGEGRGGEGEERGGEGGKPTMEVPQVHWLNSFVKEINIP